MHMFFLKLYFKVLKKKSLLQPPLHATSNHGSLLDVPDMKDVSAKWERSNTSPDIYYMCWNQMEGTHSSQHRVTAVTPVPHKKRLSSPSVNAGLGWCLQQQPWVSPAASRLNHPPPSPFSPPSLHLAPLTVVIFFKKNFFSFINTFYSSAQGDIKTTAGQRRAFLTLAPSFISLLHRACQWQWKDFTIPLGRNSFHQSSIMLNPATVPMT